MEAISCNRHTIGTSIKSFSFKFMINWQGFHRIRDEVNFRILLFLLVLLGLFRVALVGFLLRLLNHRAEVEKIKQMGFRLYWT